jgi:hypothetical protein
MKGFFYFKKKGRFIIVNFNLFHDFKLIYLKKIKQSDSL